MTVHELSTAFVGDVAVAGQNGRVFVAFKKPGEQRNTLFELNTINWTLALIGVAPGVYYKDGGCSLTFGAGGRLLMLNTCSPDPSTGAGARVVVWDTGILVGGGVGGGEPLLKQFAAALKDATAGFAVAATL